MWTALTTVRALNDRDPTAWSDNTVQVFHVVIKTVDVVLQKAHLTTLEHGILQAKLIEETKRKSKSRRSIQKGRASATADELRAKIKNRDEKEQAEALRKAKKKLTQAVNKAKRKLKEDGIQARKDEQARLQRLADCTANDELPLLKDLTRIREPDKEPNQLELARCTEAYYPELILAIQQIEGVIGSQILAKDNCDGDSDGDDDIVISTMVTRVKDQVPDYRDSSPPLPNYIDSSDVESCAGSIDSIQRNVDFVSF